MTANSAPTKKAFPRSRATIPRMSPPFMNPPNPDAIDPSTFDPFDPHPENTLDDLVTLDGKPPNPGEDEPRDRLIRRVFWDLEARHLLDLVGPEHAGNAPGAVRHPVDIHPPTVVLIRDLAHQLLDDVLKGHEARRTPVLVNDDGHLEGELSEVDQQGPAGEGFRNPRHVDEEVGHGSGRSSLIGDPDGSIHVDKAEHVVMGISDDGKT